MQATTLLFTAALLALPEDPLPGTPRPEITAAELEHHVHFLASDELEGRATGSPGSARAAAYLARALEAAGCQPGGDGESFLQAVPLRSIEHAGPPSATATTTDGERHTLEYGQDFTVSIEGAPRATGALPLVFATGPVDLPAAEQASGQAVYVDASSRDRREWLEEAGIAEVVGLIVATSPNPSRGQFSPRPRLERASGDGPETVTLRGEWAERLEAQEVVSLGITFDAEVREVTAHNVIGVLPGASDDPEIARQAIVFSAHFDHIGLVPERAIPVDAGEDFDRVNNGADDDASGVAGVLELAGALAAGEAPERTLVFLLATGEERGLLGTWHYIDHPRVSLEDTVANLNFEMIGRPDEAVGGAGQLWLTGFERTNLGPAFRERGIQVAEDARLEQNFFSRSDNIAFVRRGIVGQTLSSYNLHTDYHRPSDEADTLDYDHMETALRGALPGVLLLTGGELTPEWAPGEPNLGR